MNKEKKEKEKLQNIMESAEVKITRPQIDKEDRSEKFVRAIPEALLDDLMDRKKAYLTTRNESGILKARAINKFCSLNFDFENEVLNALEQKKIEVSLSIKGRGIDKVIEFGKAFGYSVQDTNEEGLIKGIIRKR